ncbi:calmodulin-binding transcription activator-like, partial [Tropilaelaps mercedesae]
EIAAILISFERHEQWLSKEVRIRPRSGSMLLYSRKRVRYRRDGYCWKKRKDGKTTREDHMKLKVQGTEAAIDPAPPSDGLPQPDERRDEFRRPPRVSLSRLVLSKVPRRAGTVLRGQADSFHRHDAMATWRSLPPRGFATPSRLNSPTFGERL